MMAGQFFDRFEQLLAGEKPTDQPISAFSLLPTWVWLAGAGALIALIVLIYIVAA
jgi:hypothetical protein